MKLKDILARGFAVGWIVTSSGCGGSAGQASSAPDSVSTPRKNADSPGAPLAPQTGTMPGATAKEPLIADQGAQPASGDSSETPAKAPNSDQPSARPVSAPPKSNEIQKITFDDLNCGMQADIVFRDWMLSERVKELDGRRVRISGYMLPFVKLKGISEFVLLRNTECKFGPGGQADHLIQVKLAAGVTTQYTQSPVEVVGLLKVNPTSGPDGLTWSLFDMTGQSVGVLRR